MLEDTLEVDVEVDNAELVVVDAAAVDVVLMTGGG